MEPGIEFINTHFPTWIDDVTTSLALEPAETLFFG